MESARLLRGLIGAAGLLGNPCGFSQRAQSQPTPLPPIFLQQRPAAIFPGASDDPVAIESFRKLIEAKRFNDVEILLTSYLESHPGSWQAHYDLGYTLFCKHAIMRSLEELAKSLQINLNNAEAHKILGLDLTILGDEGRAGVEFSEAERLNPDSAEIHYLLGRHYFTITSFVSSRRELETAIRLDPNYAKAYDRLGLVLEHLQEPEEALRDYQIATELSEKQQLHNEWPFLDTARFYRGRGNLDDAMRYARRAFEVNPRNDEAAFEVGQIYRSREEWALAASYFERATALNPSAPEYVFVLSQVYRRLGRKRESEGALARFKKLQADAIARPKTVDGEYGEERRSTAPSHE